MVAPGVRNNPSATTDQSATTEQSRVNDARVRLDQEPPALPDSVSRTEGGSEKGGISQFHEDKTRRKDNAATPAGLTIVDVALSLRKLHPRVVRRKLRFNSDTELKRKNSDQFFRKKMFKNVFVAPPTNHSHSGSF